MNGSASQMITGLSLPTCALSMSHSYSFCVLSFTAVAFSALTLLVECQEGHLTHKNLTDEVLAWLSSGAKCK